MRLVEYIGQASERRELKHLSNARNIKQSDSRSSGERTGRSLNLYCVIVGMRCNTGVVSVAVQDVLVLSCGFYFRKIVLERTALEGESPVF